MYKGNNKTLKTTKFLINKDLFLQSDQKYITDRLLLNFKSKTKVSYGPKVTRTLFF